MKKAVRIEKTIDYLKSLTFEEIAVIYKYLTLAPTGEEFPRVDDEVLRRLDNMDFQYPEGDTIIK